MTDTCAIICSLDNLPILKEQVRILKEDPIVDRIVVVVNGSIDGSAEWALAQDGIAVVHNKENKGASVGRNSGLEAAGQADYYLLLDGGIRCLVGGTERMLTYLETHPKADVIGVEIPDFETDSEKAWRRWPEPITKTYRNTRLSHTAYCLARHRAFDSLRFCEDGPFSEPGWACEDDEMAYQWNEAGIIVHVVTGVHPYRRASGSFRRLFKETGIWPNQYGSVYEKRLVWLQQNWPQHEPGMQWGEPWLTVVIKADGVDKTAKMIKTAHDKLRARKFEKPWDHFPNPYSIIVWCPDGQGEFLAWAEHRRLRQHHGDTTIVGGQIVRRDASNEDTWTGDFRVWEGENWEDAVRENAHYYGFVRSRRKLLKLVDRYNGLYPRQPVKSPPGVYRVKITM